MGKYFILKNSEYFKDDVYVCFSSPLEFPDDYIETNILVGGGVLIPITKEEYLEGE